MARLARIDSRIHANRLRVPELNPFFANRTSGHSKLRITGFEAIRANRSNIMKMFFCANRFTRIDSCESPRFALRIAWPSEVPNSFYQLFTECFRGRHRGGGGNFTSFLRFSGPSFSCSEMSLFYLKTCTPVKRTPGSSFYQPCGKVRESSSQPRDWKSS